jgi:hypothetical protein
MSKNKKFWTTVTPFSKFVALSMLVILPILAFLLGIQYQKSTVIETSKTGIFYFGDYCGAMEPKTKFSIELPDGWSVKKIQGDEISSKVSQQYRISNANNYIDIICGTGFGGICDTSATYLNVGNKKIDACINPKGGIDQAFMASSDGNTFSFDSNFTDRNILDQILSTFKFTN